MKFLKKYPLEVLSTIGDGSCLIHAVLQGFNKFYKYMNYQQRVNLVKSVRTDLSLVLNMRLENGKTIYQSLNRGQSEELAEYIKELDINFMQNYLDSKKFLTFFYVELLSEIFDVNLIFISSKENDFYYTGDPELLLKKRDTIFINYIDQTHFETLGLWRSKGYKTLFKYTDDIVKDAVKILFNKGK